MIVDSEKGNIVAQVSIGKRVDGVVFDPVLKMAFSSMSLILIQTNFEG